MKTGMICHIRGSNDDCRVIGTRFDGLVFRTEMSENCYTLFFNYNLQDRIYQSKDWDIWKVFSDAEITETADQTSSCQHSLSKKLVLDWIFLRGTHVLESK